MRGPLFNGLLIGALCCGFVWHTRIDHCQRVATTSCKSGPRKGCDWPSLPDTGVHHDCARTRHVSRRQRRALRPIQIRHLVSENNISQSETARQEPSHSSKQLNFAHTSFRQREKERVVLPSTSEPNVSSIKNVMKKFLTFFPNFRCKGRATIRLKG